MEKQKWFKESIQSTQVGCLCCGGTEALLPLNTKLYFGFGGWTVTKNGALFLCDDRDVEFDEYHDLQFVEDLIGEDTESEYIANFDSPLRGATYQRHSKNHWVLISENEGFA